MKMISSADELIYRISLLLVSLFPFRAILRCFNVSFEKCSFYVYNNTQMVNCVPAKSRDGAPPGLGNLESKYGWMQRKKL